MGYQDWEDEDDDLDFEDEQPKQRRRSEEPDDLVRQLRKAQRAADKRAKELEAEVQTLRAEKRKDLVANFLSEKGLNPKIAKFIPADTEINAEALNTWLDDNAELFGLAKSQGDAPDLTGLRQIDDVTSTAQIPAGADDVLLRLSQATNADEIINMINSSIQ